MEDWHFGIVAFWKISGLSSRKDAIMIDGTGGSHYGSIGGVDTTTRSYAVDLLLDSLLGSAIPCADRGPQRDFGGGGSEGVESGS